MFIVNWACIELFFFGIVGKLFSKCVFRNLHYELALSFFYDCRLNYGFSFSRIVYLGLTFNDHLIENGNISLTFDLEYKEINPYFKCKELLIIP